MRSAAVLEGRIGPVPLLRVSDFVGYNELCRPGAAARVEQFLAWTVMFMVALEASCERYVFLIGGQGACKIMHGQPRKGIPCHKAIIDTYLQGMEIRDQDRVVIVDIVPNRCTASGCGLLNIPAYVCARRLHIM